MLDAALSACMDEFPDKTADVLSHLRSVVESIPAPNAATFLYRSSPQNDVGILQQPNGHAEPQRPSTLFHQTQPPAGDRRMWQMQNQRPPVFSPESVKPYSLTGDKGSVIVVSPFKDQGETPSAHQRKKTSRTMASWWPGCVLLLTALVVPVELYEIAESDAHSIHSLNLKLLRASQNVYEPPNPSIHIGLRLSKEHNLEKERQHLQRLREAFKPITSSPDVDPQPEASTGRLALYLLALRASCEDLNTKEDWRLITHLKHQLHKEKQHIAEAGTPISSYYQYSLGLLALCVNHKKIDAHVVQKLLQAEEQKKFTLEGESSVDTEAVAGLAFLCLKRSGLYSSELTEKLRVAFGNVKGKILLSQGADGAFGNIYSTALAVQVLAASKAGVNDAESSKAVESLVKSLKLGLFSNPMVMSQVLPVLHHKTYLDIAKMDCKQDIDTLVLRSGSLGSTSAKPISIRLTVEGSPNLVSGYSKLLQVPTGSSLLEVLQEVQRQDLEHFSFETQDTLSGPFVSMVQGVKATQMERTYWQLLKEQDTPLIEGVADYRPEDGEVLVLRLARW